KKMVNPRFALKTFQLIATGLPLACPSVDALEGEFIACGVVRVVSSINVSSGLLLHQCNSDSATDCAEEPTPDVFPLNNPEQPTSKTLIINTARENQDCLANREMPIYFLILCNPDTKRDHILIVGIEQLLLRY